MITKTSNRIYKNVYFLGYHFEIVLMSKKLFYLYMMLSTNVAMVTENSIVEDKSHGFLGYTSEII